MLPRLNPFEYFTDTNGDPLDGGYVYIGTANQNPKTSPVTVYFDSAMTIPAPQPLRTTAGRIVKSGSPAAIYSNAATLSILVENKSGQQVAYTATAENDASANMAALAASSGASLVGFLQSGSGAVARTLQSKTREIVSVTDYGATGDGSTNDTAAFAAALAAADRVYIPAPSVSYRVSSITVGEGKELITDGFATVLHQVSGTAVGTRIIEVVGSNVVIGDMTVKGNIATDTNEQNHGVFIQSNASAGNLSNITIGDIYGQDIRGDVLYIGATTGYLTTYVRFGRISGSNILRNVVSVVGAAYVTGDAAISSGATGLWALDIEPNTVTCHDIHVGYVRGAAMGCVPPLSANAVYNISIGMADLDPSFAPDSTPGYSLRDVQNALYLRNTKSFKIGYLKAKDHTHHAIKYIWNVGEQRGEGIEIGYLDVNNVGASESTYNTCILASAVNYITIRDGRVTHNAAGDSVIMGDSSGSTFTRAVIDRMVVDGRVASYISQGRFTNIIVNSVAATSAFFQCNDSTVMDSDITVPTLINFSSRNTFVNVKATCSTAYYGSSVADTTRINCNFGGNVVGLATQRASTTTLSGEIGYSSTTSTTVGAAGGASALPATPSGYITVNIGGTDRKVPYYAT